MNKYQRIGIRVAIATNVALLVAVIACLVAWRNTGSMHGMRPEQWATHLALSDLEGMIERELGHPESPPASLEELRHRDQSWHRIQRNQNGSPLDGWGRPFLYSVDGTRYVITSLGRDAKPGGIGLDCDLSNRDAWPRQAVPTLGQFLVHRVTRGMIFTCLTCGVLAGLLSLITVKPSALESRAVLSLLVKLGVTVLGALFAADMMSFLHIPNYH